CCRDEVQETMSEVIIRCLYDEMVPVEDLIPDPENRNSHPSEQVERLAKIIQYSGWRYPIKVSKQTGIIKSGNGRLLSAKHIGMTHVPVNYQDYDDSDMEYADGIADNEIARWSDLDLGGVNSDIEALGPDLDIETLGLKNFKIDISEKTDHMRNERDKDLDIKKNDKKCPECGALF
ncbi:ParB N-terminal domain-containing protein, partial [Candidatus Babeliales bacterium]|nr:ParB N-terminal domain-containing protein [Candidatus Babeliales bacterium]